MLHYDIVCNLIKKYWGKEGDIIFLEIGVLGGIMEKTLLSSFDKIKIISIEPGVNPFDEEELKRIKFINKVSDEACKEIENNTIDFVYIDGDHSYEQCKKDILNYLPLTKKKSIIGGHDYHPHWGVIQAVNEIFGEPCLGDDLTWWIPRSELKIEGSFKSVIFHEDLEKNKPKKQQDQEFLEKTMAKVSS